MNDDVIAGSRMSEYLIPRVVNARVWAAIPNKSSKEHP